MILDDLERLKRTLAEKVVYEANLQKNLNEDRHNTIRGKMYVSDSSF